VRLTNGDIRNGYMVDISNKMGRPADYVLTLDGPKGLTARPAGVMHLHAAADSILELRVWVSAPPESAHGSQRLLFRLHNLTNGEKVRYESVFLGPK